MPGLFDLDQGIVAAESENEKLLKKARSLCIRELYDRALEIYNGILDEDPECLQAYLGILEVHSENYTKYDSEDIERDIRVINRAFEDVEDEEFLSYLQERKKALKGKKPKKEEKPAEAEEAKPAASSPKKNRPKQKSASTSLSEEDAQYKKAFATLRSSERQGELMYFDPEMSKRDAESIVKTLTPYAEAGFLKAYCGIIACNALFLKNQNKAEQMVKKAYALLSGDYDFDNPCHVFILTAYCSLVDPYMYHKLADGGYNTAHEQLGFEVYGDGIDNYGIESVRCWRKYLETPYKNEYLPYPCMSFLDENGDHKELAQNDFESSGTCAYATMKYYQKMSWKTNDPKLKRKYEEISARWSKVSDDISDRKMDPIKAMRKNGIGPNDD